MAIASNLTTGPYTANGSQTAFAFTFTVVAGSEIRVQVNGIDQSSSLYTVTVNADGTGMVTFSVAPANGASVLLISEPNFLQETQYEIEGDYSLDSVNRVNRRDGVRANWLYRQIAKLLPSGWESATNRAGKFLSWDGSGNPFVSSGTGADAGLRTDLVASSGAALSGFINSGTGATARTVQAKLRDKASPKDFGAVGDGSTNDAAALTALFAAKTDVEASFSDTYAIQSGLTLTGDDRTIRGLKIKPTTTRNLTALTIGPTSPDASTTLSVNAAVFATSVTLTSVTGFSTGKLILFTFTNPTWTAADPLAASYQFVTRIVGVSGSVVELQDALPQAIQSAWTHSVQAWTPVRDLKLSIEIDQSAQGQKRTITAITQANPAVITTSESHGFTTGDTVDLNGPITGMTQIRSARGVVTVISPTTFSIPVNASGYSAYTSGATVRQVGTGVRIGCVENCDIEIVGYDNDGSGALAQIDIAYGGRISVSARNCGNGNAGEVQATCYTNCQIDLLSDEPSGFGPTLLGGHYSNIKLGFGSRSDLGRGFKMGKCRFNTAHLGSVNNPAFTAIGLTWAAQDNSLYCSGAIASARFAVQPVGFWTSACYNTGNKVFGLIAKGSTNYDAQVNSTDEVEFVGCTIDKLDVPTGGTVTLVGGSAGAITGAGTVSRVQGSQITVRTTAQFPADFYSDSFYYVRTYSNAATSGQSGFQAQARDSGGTMQAFTIFNVAGNGAFNVPSTFSYSFQVNNVEVAGLSAARLTMAVPINFKSYTVATLPASPVANDRAVVTDANATTFASVVAGGGANRVPVYYDGTNWRIG